MNIRQISQYLCCSLFVLFFPIGSHNSVYAEPAKYTVGVATVLSGDLAVLGDNIQKTISTYQKHNLRHKIDFKFQDAKKSSVDGLSAYRHLIEVDKVNFLIGGTTSNATLAASPLINSSKTVFITPVTGGSNIDQAGPYVFRIGNSDILNGVNQAELFIKRGIHRVALLTEETEYTQDIAKHFRLNFKELGGELVSDENFLPDSTDFRSQITGLMPKAPEGLFMSTQTGLAFGLFVKQLREVLPLGKVEIHTNFLAASNPDAIKVAGNALKGVHYLAPEYNSAPDSAYHKFEQLYLAEHGHRPSIPFHTAGTVDALNMFQNYLDKANGFSAEGFQQYLLAQIKNYQGLMGTYSFDAEGNSNLGFSPKEL